MQQAANEGVGAAHGAGTGRIFTIHTSLGDGDMTASGVRPSSMGIFAVRIHLYSLRRPDRVREIEATVDTGALFPVLPRAILRQLDAKRGETRTFQLANGKHLRRDIAQIGIEFEGHRAATSVVVGEPGDAVLLGSVALESLGYEVDPVHKTLRPTTLYLMALRPRGTPRASST